MTRRDKDQPQRRMHGSWASRDAAMKVLCPLCSAQPDGPCIGKRGIRKAIHVERYGAAKLRVESARRK